MKYFFSLLFVLSAALPLIAQEEGEPEFEMREYFMVILKRGENRSQDSVKAMEIQAAHIAHIQKMHAEGKLAIAGPFGDDGEMRGIFILTVDNIEQAKELAESDPAVKAGRLKYDVHSWWSARGSCLP